MRTLDDTTLACGFPIEHVRVAHVHNAFLHAVVGAHGYRCATRACRFRMNAIVLRGHMCMLAYVAAWLKTNKNSALNDKHFSW